MQIRPLSDHLGAEVRGLDLSAPLSDEQFADVHRTFIDHKMLCFKEQSLSARAQVDFSRRFGPLMVHVLTQYNHPEFPEIFRLSNRVIDGVPQGIADGGSYWHSDFAFFEKPAKATLLNAIEIPAEGGNTLFANMEAAWEALPAEQQRRLRPLKAVHRYRKRSDTTEQTTRVELTEAQRQQTPDVVHPLIRTNGDSGRLAIFAHPGMTAEIVGLPEAESRALLDELFAHCTRPEFRYEFRWSAGDVVIWDNRSTMHSATTRELPAGVHRSLLRTTMQGERPH